MLVHACNAMPCSGLLAAVLRFTCIGVVAERRHSSSTVRAQAVAAPAAEASEQVSTDIHGFKLERQQWVAEYNSTVLLYKHKKTGQHACNFA